MQASADIMRVLARTLGQRGAIMEKGGLDEVYIDCSAMVVSRCAQLSAACRAATQPGAAVQLVVLVC